MLRDPKERLKLPRSQLYALCGTNLGGKQFIGTSLWLDYWVKSPTSVMHKAALREGGYLVLIVRGHGPGPYMAPGH